MVKLKELLNDIYAIYELNYLMIVLYQKLADKKQLNNCIYQINEIYGKYNINNVDELISLVSEYSKSSHIVKDKELVKLLVFLILDSKKRNILDYNDNIIKELYKYIIENNLYDPNWNIGVSNEPLFVMLPESSDLFNINLLVFKDESIDWNILNNGTDSFISFIYKYLNSNSSEEKTYYFEIIKSAIDKIDFDSTKRYKSIQRNVCYEVESIRETLKKMTEQDDIINHIINLIDKKTNSSIKKLIILQ